MGTLPIPISAGKHIAEAYGYDQVVIVARKVGGVEHVTTFGVTPEHCTVAARMGDFFKHKLMGWPQPAAALLLAEIERMDRAAHGILPAAEQKQPLTDGWRPMETAPLDGTLVRLLVKFDNHAIEDTSEPTATIGSHNDGEWNFVGWDWHRDEWTRGSGDLLGWLPMGPSAPAPAPR